MGHGNKGICIDDFRADIDLLIVREIDLNPCLTFSEQSVGNDQGSPVHGGIGKSVIHGSLYMGDGIGPGAHIQGIGIGEKGGCPGFSDGPDDLSDIDRPDKGGIPLFPEMNLHGGQVFIVHKSF